MVKGLTNLRLETDGQKFFIASGSGRLASLTTLEHAKDFVRKSVLQDTGLRNYTNEILLSNGLDSHSPQNFIIDTIHSFVQNNIQYVSDPSGGLESIQSPRETLERGAGDCDDLSILECALLGHIGIDTAFVAARYNADTVGFDHLFLQAVTRTGEKVFLDPTIKSQAAGWYRRDALDMLFSPIFTDGWEDEALSQRASVRDFGRSLARSIDDLVAVARPVLGFIHPTFAGIDTAAQIVKTISPSVAVDNATGGQAGTIKGNGLPVILAFAAGGLIVYWYVRK